MFSSQYCLVSILFISLVLYFSSAQKEFQDEGMKVHNQFRKKHASGKLKLLPELNQMAQDCAEEYAKRGSYEEGKCEIKGVGLNLFVTNRKINESTIVRNAVNIWYNSSSGYNYENPEESTALSGCFTQVVWKGSKSMGVGLASSGTKECQVGDRKIPNCTFVATVYKPPGNVIDRDGGYSKYKTNVLKPVSK